MKPAPRTTIVIATDEARALARVLGELGVSPLVERIVVVDRRPAKRATNATLPTAAAGALSARVDVVAAYGCGPVAARNAGWRAATSPWVVFLAQEALPASGWLAALGDDLRSALGEADGSLDAWGDDRGEEGPVVAVHGRVEVNLPGPGPPTERERRALARAAPPWAGTDAAYRRDVLAATGGLDERVGDVDHAHLDLDLRATRFGRVRRGRRVVGRAAPAGRGSRAVRHRARDRRAEAHLRRVHGVGWRSRVGVAGDGVAADVLSSVALTTAVAAIAGTAARWQRRALLGVAAASGSAWAADTLRRVVARTRAGPRSLPEIAAIVLTGPAEPLGATWGSLAGAWRSRRARPWRPAAPAALVLDRALVRPSTPWASPAAEAPPPDVVASVADARAAGMAIGIVAVADDIAAGRASATQVEADIESVADAIGGVDGVAVCSHASHEGCACRPPAPGLVTLAAARLGVDPTACVVVSERFDVVAAASAARARGICWITERTPASEAASAVERVSSLREI